MRVGLAVPVLLLLVMAAPRSESGRRERPISIGDNGSIIIPVTIAGRGPFPFLLDTGTNRTVVSAALARRLNLPAVTGTQLVTPAGQTTGVVVRLDRLTLDGVPGASSLRALVAPEDVRRQGRRASGIIGQDVLGAHVYTIDYLERTITWHDAPPASRASRLPLEAGVGGWRVRLRQVAARRSTWCPTPVPTPSCCLMEWRKASCA